MAGKKFSELNAATEANGADLLAAAQDKGGGVLETRKLTLAQFLAWLRENNDPRYAQLSEAAHFLDTLDVDGAVALADTLRVAKKATLEGDLDVDGAVALLQMLTVGGDPLIKAKDAAKLTGGDDADFAAMVKVGGVNLISSGGTNAGGWVQLASGLLLQFYRGDSGRFTWTYPKPYTSAPIILTGTQTSPSGYSRIASVDREGPNGGATSTKVDMYVAKAVDSKSDPADGGWVEIGAIGFYK